MVWKPAKALGLVSGLIIGLTIIGIDILLVGTILKQPLGLTLFFAGLLLVLSIPLFIVWAYAYSALATLRYDLDRNRLVIRCSGVRRVIPMTSIQRIVQGTEALPGKEGRGIRWPGYYGGWIDSSTCGRIRLYSTEPLEHQLIIVTDMDCFGISPRLPARFLEDFQSRRALGPIRDVAPSFARTGLMGWPGWQDALFWGLVLAGLVANAGLAALILSRFAGLPPRIPMHFGIQGQVDRIASKNWLLLIPGIGALAWGLNTLLSGLLYQRERPGAYLLIWVAFGIQIVMWLAALDILA